MAKWYLILTQRFVLGIGLVLVLFNLAFSAPTVISTKKVIVFFSLVNKTGKDILLKALADGEYLFVQDIEAEIRKHPGELPPRSGKYPEKELKIEIDTDAKNIEVQETYSGMVEKFDITSFSKKAGGFRIIVTEQKIFLNQDYFPIYQ